jgi:CRISPR-associated protein Cas8c/Csd1, subtype I-C/DVULG
MSWMEKLSQTYDNCTSMIGVMASEEDVPLLPICHTTQKAQVEITIDEKSNFKSSMIIPKKEARTIIPCTEASSGRTSGEAAHPLCDKLQYIAADYNEYGGDKESYYESYHHQLEEWVNKGAPLKVKLIYDYIKQKRVIKDLVDHGTLLVGNDGKLLNQKPGEEPKNGDTGIFDVVQNNRQADAFVRWKVEIPGDPQSDVWNDAEIIESWKKHYLSSKQTKALCYVSGQEVLSAEQHPAKIRTDGDKAKLISSNDLQGFTFRGRFISAEQAAGVSLEITQKAHFALRWLIARQGYVKNDLSIVAWAVSGNKIPQPTDDAINILFDDLPEENNPNVNTAQEIAIKLNKKIAGYGKEIGDTAGIIVMGLDSATTGRLSIIYYRELTGSDFLSKVNSWHESCAWLHQHRYVNDQSPEVKTKPRLIPFIGAPSPNDIAESAYGSRVDDKLRKATITRLLPCIIDGQPIPRDLMESVVRRASNRIVLNEYDWNKTLSIACAIYRKYKQGKESYDMSLDESRTTRDYLYGRLLAIADALEERALYKGEQKRATNAARYMQQFSQRPFRTWRQIHDSLSPYMLRLNGAYYYKNLIAEVEGLFDHDDFISNKPLTGEYLLGYYCQRQKLNTKSKTPMNEKEADQEVTDE